MLYLAVRGSVETHDADGAGIVWQAPIVLALAAGLAVWWTRRTILRLGSHARITMWRVLHRSVLYAVRFWCVVVSALAVVVVGLGVTGPMRAGATDVAITALGVGFLAAWADLAVTLVRQTWERRGWPVPRRRLRR